MVFHTINKKLLELGPSLGFLYKKKRVLLFINMFLTYKRSHFLYFGLKIMQQINILQNAVRPFKIFFFLQRGSSYLKTRQTKLDLLPRNLIIAIHICRRL